MSKRQNAVLSNEAPVETTIASETVDGTEVALVATNTLGADLATVAATATPAPKKDEPVLLNGKDGASWIKEHTNKSNAIRAMAAAGHKRGDIAKCLGIRYQHVRNVLLQNLKRQAKEAQAAPAAQA